jgi:acyl-CoA thioesterase I
MGTDVTDHEWRVGCSNGKKVSNRPQLEAYNDNYRRYAKDHSPPLLDHYPNWLRLKETQPDQFQTRLPDGTHPDKEGSLAVTWPTVKAWLEKTQSAAKTTKR